MSEKIKMGIVGLGRIGWGMAISELEEHTEQIEIVAACDLIQDRCNNAAEKFGCPTYLDYSEMLKQENIELVYICTRSCDHFAHAMMALAAGKHVLLEKPATTSYADALKLFDSFNKEGTPRLFIHQQRRFESAFMEVQKIINSGKLGKVYEVNIEQADYQRRDDWQTISEFGGGQLLNWGPHIIDHSLQLLGTPTADVSSYIHCVAAGGDCEDHLRIRFVGDNDRVVTMCISGGMALKGGRNFEVYGDRGALIANNCDFQLRYINPEQIFPPVVSSPETPGAAFGATGTYESAQNPDWVTEQYTVDPDRLTVFWDYMYDSLRNGTPFPVTDSDVLAIMRTISTVKAQNKKIMRA